MRRSSEPWINCLFASCFLVVPRTDELRVCCLGCNWSALRPDGPVGLVDPEIVSSVGLSSLMYSPSKMVRRRASLHVAGISVLFFLLSPFMDYYVTM